MFLSIQAIIIVIGIVIIGASALIEPKRVALFQLGLAVFFLGVTLPIVVGHH